MVLALSSTGCAVFWPNDDVDEPATSGCHPTRRAPTIATSVDGGERILVDSTDHEVSLIDLQVEANGGDFIGAVHISHGVGTMEVSCKTLRVAIRRKSSSSAVDYYYALAVARDRFYDIGFQCQDGRTTSVTYRGTDGTPDSTDSIVGSCGEALGTVSAIVQFPAIDMPVPHPVTGYTIDGAEISLASDGTGTVVLDSISNDLLVYSDWRGTNWAQLYVLIRDPSRTHLSDAVINMRSTGSIILFEAITLPGFQDEIGSHLLTATYTLR